MYIDAIKNSQIKDNVFEIFNTAHADEPGQHWFIVIDFDDKTYSFDSYGRNLAEILAPQGVNLPHSLSNLINISSNQLQNVATVVCGHYIIDFAIQLKNNNGDPVKAWNDLISFYHPIREELNPTSKYIDKTTLHNDILCFHKINSVFPQLYKQ
jgi:hypothetical protein